MKNCVYIFLCCNLTYYIGSATDLKIRLDKHLTGQVKSTKNLRPLKLMFYQDYSTAQEARRIEYWLKKQKDKKLIERIIKEQKISKKL